MDTKSNMNNTKSTEDLEESCVVDEDSGNDDVDDVVDVTKLAEESDVDFVANDNTSKKTVQAHE